MKVIRCTTEGDLVIDFVMTRLMVDIVFLMMMGLHYGTGTSIVSVRRWMDVVALGMVDVRRMLRRIRCIVEVCVAETVL